MKQSVKQKIQQLQRKYLIKKRSTNRAPQEYKKNFKTQSEMVFDHVINQSRLNNRSQHYKSHLSEHNYKNSLKYTPIQTFKQFNDIGKKYFDLSVYKAQHFQVGIRGQKERLKLPSLIPSLRTILKEPSQMSKLLDSQSQEMIKARALRRVEQIYRFQQQSVEMKYEKIKKVKNRLTLLDKINFDKYKLKQKYAHLCED